MKTAKTIIGILGMVIFVIIMLQSCATGIANAMGENTTDTSGWAGVMIALMFLVGGIISTAGRNSRGASFAAMLVFAVGALFGFANIGTFADLVVWSWLAIILAVLYLIFFIVQRPARKEIG